jgi:hypothetical protein
MFNRVCDVSGGERMPSAKCFCCARRVRVDLPRVCPECGHVFAGGGWHGIDAHWRSKHNDVMPYEEFSASLCARHGGKPRRSIEPPDGHGARPHRPVLGMPKLKRQGNASWIRKEIAGYLQTLATLQVGRLPTGEPLELFKALKRRPVRGGPYPGRTIFEVANRVMSDLVVLGAAETLLCEPPPELGPFRVRKIAILLGNENGECDLLSDLDNGARLRGECFNVAPTFFSTKFRQSCVALNKREADVRVIAFNKDAREFDSRMAQRWKEKGFVIVPVDVPKKLDDWQAT